MDSHAADRFEKIGARLKVSDRVPPRLARWSGIGRPSAQPNYNINILRDREGEYFAISADPKVELQVVASEPQLRHLVLMVKDGKHKDKYLCGHDERHWFVAGVPAAATSVRKAMELLQPEAVQERAKVVPPAKRLKRRSRAFLRQGEWFFVPAPEFRPDPKTILKNEPLRRDMRAKPHHCSELVRIGGETVYVAGGVRPFDFRNLTPTERDDLALGLTEGQKKAFIVRHPETAEWTWRVMMRNPEVYARGYVRHSDHSTVELKGWYRVHMNAETRDKRFRFSVSFLD